jgi:hypothetical protein
LYFHDSCFQKAHQSKFASLLVDTPETYVSYPESAQTFSGWLKLLLCNCRFIRVVCSAAEMHPNYREVKTTGTQSREKGNNSSVFILAGILTGRSFDIDSIARSLKSPVVL